MELSLSDFLCPELLSFCEDDDVFDPLVTASIPTAVAFAPATAATTNAQLALTSIDTIPALVSSTISSATTTTNAQLALTSIDTSPALVSSTLSSATLPSTSVLTTPLTSYFQNASSPLTSSFTTVPVFPSPLTSSTLTASSTPSSSAATALSIYPAPPTSSYHQQQHSRFTVPKTNQQVQEERQNGIPKNTQQDTKFCLNLWEQWSLNRQSTTGEQIGSILSLTPQQLNYWLTRFILEVRKRDGSQYPPNTIHHITAGIMRYLRWNGKPNIDLFKDPEFREFRDSLDAEMKRLQREGLGTKKKQAEVISEEEEDLLWQNGLLGEEDPKMLLNTVIFYNGLYFALRSGQEHRQLRLNPCQIEVIRKPGETPFLRYKEDVSKNNPGGLKGRKVKQKVVEHHANVDNQDRCFVRIFEKYRSLCPSDAISFYLQPARNPTATCWYSNNPLGHNSLSTTVTKLCKEAGITGFKTNHSLRATATSRLYHSGIDEQLVMERTGHRSLEGVRSYKRTSDEQRRHISDIMNRATTASSSSSVSTGASSIGNGIPQGATFTSCTVNFYGSTPSPTQPQRRRRVIYDSDSD